MQHLSHGRSFGSRNLRDPHQPRHQRAARHFRRSELLATTMLGLLGSLSSRSCGAAADGDQPGSNTGNSDTEQLRTSGPIFEKWMALGGAEGFLGEPTTDETSTPDGRGLFCHFQNGSVYWSPSTGAHEVHGEIRWRGAEGGWEQSALGYPTSDEFPTTELH